MAEPDDIIIGAGSAGAVVANRWSEAPNPSVPLLAGQPHLVAPLADAITSFAKDQAA